MLSAISFGTWVALLCLVALIGLEIYFLITLNPILIVIGGRAIYWCCKERISPAFECDGVI